MLSAVLPSMSAVLSAETVGDPESTRRVYTTVVILLVLGVAMVVLAIWLFRRTRPEPQLLAPLEVMDTRRWRRSEPAQRGRELDEKRPPGARPLRRAAERPLIDSEFGTAQPVRSFDDLAADADQPAASTDDIGPVQRRSPDAGDPTPAEQDAFDISAADALSSVGSDNGDSDGSGATDEHPLHETGERPRIETDETGLADRTDDVDETRDDGGVDRNVDVDALSDPEVTIEFTGEGEVDSDDCDPVMPGEGLSRRPCDPSS